MFEFDIANPSVRAATARERVLDDLSRDHPFDHSVNSITVNGANNANRLTLQHPASGTAD